jgi:hypothetical protein
MNKRLTDYQVDVVRGWARDHKRAGLDETEAVQRCCLHVEHEEHVHEVVAAVYARKASRQ